MNILYPNKVMANIHVSWLDPHKVRKITIVGSKKMAVYDDVLENEKVQIYDKGLAFPHEGNGNGKCNSLDDADIDDFDDLDETDVIGGNKFASITVEYRFPIAESLGLMGILFFDIGNAFDRDWQSILDFGEWRQGTGVGLLWFSPFGPLQAFLGFPLDKLEVDESMAFEFSVGGQGF